MQARGFFRYGQASLAGYLLLFGLVLAGMLGVFFYAEALSHRSASSASHRARAMDAFDREVQGSWGSGPSGEWRYEVSSGSPFRLDVGGGVAEAHSPAGENKGNLIVGDPTPGPVDVRATFSVDHEPATGTPNHWQVIVRHQGIRDYYAAQRLPSGSGPATVSIFAAKAGVFTELGRVPLSFAPVAGQAYVIEAKVWDEGDSVHVAARTWPMFAERPSRWQVSIVDHARDRLVDGTVGVRLSMYAGPVTATVDDFIVTRG